MSPCEEYKKRKELYSKQLANVNKEIKNISNLRFAIFLIVCIGGIFLYRSHYFVFLTIEVVFGVIAFIWAVLWHNDLYNKADILKRFITINDMGLQRVSGKWHGFKDFGDEFIDHEHPYSWDLDIFGENSIYQWICTCHTFLGRIFLADVLRRQDSIDYAKKRQLATTELAPRLDWRQQFEVNGFLSATGSNPDKFLGWAENPVQTFNNKVIIGLFRLLPYISLVLGCIGYFLLNSLLFFAAVYTIQLLIFGLYYAKTTQTIKLFEKNGRLLLAYSEYIKSIEREEFSSDYLKECRNKLLRPDSKKASSVFLAVAKIINASEIKSSLVYAIANVIWLWDIQCVIKADRLKKQYGADFRKWIETIGLFESLSSLSIIPFEHPDWAMPLLSDESCTAKARNVGHPLLNDSERICNDFEIEGGNKAVIITGSNMSGKSTFLRSIGANLVLAYSGAPVCASFLSCSLLNVYSSMRVNDDLSSKISTFYAELLRIKKIVEAVRRGERILFLLDELFRGTNSQDRHDGAVAVLRALLNEKTIGIISTHDMELCKLSEKEDKKFINYHFEEAYRGDKITFDYKLKSGQSLTKNAMFLIRMMGIET